MNPTHALALLVVALVALMARAQDFPDVEECSGGFDADGCPEALAEYCDTQGWDSDDCAAVRVSCPFTTTAVGGNDSPCSVSACVGDTPDETNCLAAINTFCDYHNAHMNDDGFTYDAKCAGVNSATPSPSPSPSTGADDANADSDSDSDSDTDATDAAMAHATALAVVVACARLLWA